MYLVSISKCQELYILHFTQSKVLSFVKQILISDFFKFESNPWHEINKIEYVVMSNSYDNPMRLLSLFFRWGKQSSSRKSDTPMGPDPGFGWLWSLSLHEDCLICHCFPCCQIVLHVWALLLKTGEIRGFYRTFFLRKIYYISNPRYCLCQL